MLLHIHGVFAKEEVQRIREALEQAPLIGAPRGTDLRQRAQRLSLMATRLRRGQERRPSGIDQLQRFKGHRQRLPGLGRAQQPLLERRREARGEGPAGGGEAIEPSVERVGLRAQELLEAEGRERHGGSVPETPRRAQCALRLFWFLSCTQTMR